VCKRKEEKEGVGEVEREKATGPSQKALEISESLWKSNNAVWARFWISAGVRFVSFR